MTRMRILCISDSLGLPRPGVSYDQTWFAMLQNNIEHIEFISNFQRNATTDSLYGWDYGETLLFYNPNQVILQLGICDCSPRYIRTTSVLYRLLNKSPKLFSTTCWKIVKLFFKRSIKRADVSVERFEANVRHYLNKCFENGVERVIVVMIATPASAMVSSNPKVVDAVHLYNNMYEKVAVDYPNVVCINPLDNPIDEHFTTDGYHPNVYGNSLVASAISATII